MDVIEEFVRSRVKGSEPLVIVLIREISSWLKRGYSLEEVELEEFQSNSESTRGYRIHKK